MVVTNPREVPEYELNPQELQVRKADGISKVRALSASISRSNVLVLLFFNKVLHYHLPGNISSG